MGNSSLTPSIHVLDDDCLLNIFYLHRPAIFDGDKGSLFRIDGGRGWDRERWWYRLAQVCQRWRKIILRSTSYLDLCLVCTPGTPIADMLANSPPLPLIIDYHKHHNISAEEENEIIFALEQRERVHRVRISFPVPNMERFITVIEGEYPILEYLIMSTPVGDKSANLILTETFQAPHLRYLTLIGFAILIGSRLLTTAVGLVSLFLARRVGVDKRSQVIVN